MTEKLLVNGKIFGEITNISFAPNPFGHFEKGRWIEWSIRDEATESEEKPI